MSVSFICLVMLLSIHYICGCECTKKKLGMCRLHMPDDMHVVKDVIRHVVTAAHVRGECAPVTLGGVACVAGC